MEFTDVQNYINENSESEDVKGLIKSFQQPITRDAVENWCKEGEGRSWRDSICDIYSQKAVETARTNALEKFKKEELPKLQEEYYKNKTNEGMTEEQKQVRELQTQLEKMQKQQKINETKNNYSKVFAEKGLDVRMLDFLNLDRENDLIDKDISTMEEIFKSNVNSKVEETFKNNPTPPSGNESTGEQLSGFEKEFYKLNPDLK